MLLRAILVKPGRGRAMRHVARVTAVAGVGLDGDCHGGAASPRQVLVVGAPALRALDVGAEELRGNLVIDGDIDALPSGTVLHVGGAVLRLTIACESCATLERTRPGLQRAADGRRGVLARVLRGGVLVVGDAVVIDERGVAPLPARWQTRVADLVRAVPPGRVMTFAQLATAAGVQAVYCRAFRPLLARLAAEDPRLPVDRIVSGDGGGVPTWDGADLHAARDGINPRVR